MISSISLSLGVFLVGTLVLVTLGSTFLLLTEETRLSLPLATVPQLHLGLDTFSVSFFLGVKILFNSLTILFSFLGAVLVATVVVGLLLGLVVALLGLEATVVSFFVSFLRFFFT